MPTKPNRSVAEAIEQALKDGTAVETSRGKLPTESPILRPEISEKEFQAAVVQYATAHDWTAYHTFDSRRSQPGFPDLVFRRGPGYAVRIVVAELKVPPNKPSTEQYAWLAAFDCMGIPSFFWLPTDWPTIEKVLHSKTRD